MTNQVFFSPDRSGNPFAFFFKKQKIGTDSGISSLKKMLRISTENLSESQRNNKISILLLIFALNKIEL